MPKPQVIRHADKAELGVSGAQRIFEVLTSTLAEKPLAHISLTGGSMGIAVLAELARHPRLSEVDFSKVHFWWSDERFVAAGHEDRNEQQAKDALLSQLDIPAKNLHIMGSTDTFETPEAAAQAYAAELAEYAEKDDAAPVFDLTLLGMGPDGHIASLFPHREEIHLREGVALAIHDSPKPPPTRVSLTLPVIRASQRIWFLIAGSDKAEATARLTEAAKLSDEQLIDEVLTETPAAGARGLAETLVLATEDSLTA